MLKHPELTRVFSIVLCCLAVILLLCVLGGVNGALKDLREDQRVHGILTARTEEYETLSEKLSEEDPSDKLSAELDKLQTQHGKNKANHQTALSTYTATKGGLKQGREQMDAASEMMSVSNALSYAQSAISQLEAAVLDIGDAAFNAYANYDVAAKEALPYEMAYYEALAMMEFFPEDPAAAQAAADAYEAMIPYEMAKEEAEGMLTSIGQSVTAKTDSVGGGGDLLSSVNTLAAGIDAMNAGKEQLEKMELQMVKDSIDLSLTKSKLEKEEDEINALSAKLDETKADERRLISLRVNLTANDNIKAVADKGGDVLTAAKAEMDHSQKAYRRSLAVKLCYCACLLLAAAAAFFGVPAAFEKTKSRAALILPVVLFIVFSAAADVLNLYIKGEQQYAALLAAMFGVVQLLICTPQNEQFFTEEEDEE